MPYPGTISIPPGKKVKINNIISIRNKIDILTELTRSFLIRSMKIKRHGTPIVCGTIAIAISNGE